jgi:hypothetical protein
MTLRFQLNFATVVFNIWCKTQTLKTSDALSGLYKIFWDKIGLATNVTVVIFFLLILIPILHTSIIHN